MPAPDIDALPPVPLRTEAAGTFTPKAETFLDSLDTFRTQVNAVGDYIDSLGLDPADLPTAVTDLQMASARLIGRTTAGAGAAEELTAAQVRTFLALESYILPFFFTSTPTDSETLLIHVAGAAFTIPANFASALQSYVGTNPTATFDLDIAQNGTSIGTISVSTGGVVSATTASGTAKTISAGDRLTATGPATADATAADMAFTIVGVR